jgi:hypothetical protein
MTPLLANASAELVREWSFTASEVFWQSVIVLVIVLLNAFFVAAEFAIVKVRDSQLTAAIEEGTRGAKFAQTVTRNLDAYSLPGSWASHSPASRLGFLASRLSLSWCSRCCLKSASSTRR